MEISKKEDFKFVTQDELKCVQVTGKPYPVREQKLITRGEDIAYLTEALRERSIGTSNIVLFDDRILKIIEDNSRYSPFENTYNAIEKELSKGYWFNESRLSNVSDIGLVYECTEGDAEEDKKKVNQIEEIYYNFKDELESVTANKDNEDDDAEDKLKTDKSLLLETFENDKIALWDDRWSQEIAISNNYSAKKETENKRYNEAKELLIKKLEAGEIDGVTYTEELEKEGNLHTKIYNQLKTQESLEIHYVKENYDKEVQKLEKKYAEDIKALQSNYDIAQSHRDSQYNKDTETIRNNYYSQITSLKPYPERSSYIIEHIEEELGSIYQRDKKLIEATERVPFSKVWFDKKIQPGKDPTPLDRLFADLERMTTWRDEKGDDRTIHITRQGNVEVDENWDFYLSDIGDSYKYYAYNNNYPSVKIIGGREIWIAFGKRDDIGRVDKISLDVYTRRKAFSTEKGDSYQYVAEYQGRLMCEYAGLLNEDLMKTYDERYDGLLKNIEGLTNTANKEIDNLKKKIIEANQQIDKERRQYNKKRDEALEKKYIERCAESVAQYRTINASYNAKIVEWRKKNEDKAPIPDEFKKEWEDAVGKIKRCSTILGEIRLERSNDKFDSSELEQELITPLEEGIWNLSSDLEKATDNVKSDIPKLKDEIYGLWKQEVDNIEVARINAVNQAKSTYIKALENLQSTYTQEVHEVIQDYKSKYPLLHITFNITEYTINITWWGIFPAGSSFNGEDLDRYIERTKATYEEETKKLRETRTTAVIAAARAEWEAKKKKFILSSAGLGDDYYRMLFVGRLYTLGEDKMLRGSMEYDKYSNVVIHYRPRSLLGMDISKYRKEQGQDS